MLTVAEVTEKLGSLADGRVKLEESHMTMAKVYMRPGVLVRN